MTSLIQFRTGGVRGVALIEDGLGARVVPRVQTIRDFALDALAEGVFITHCPTFSGRRRVARHFNR